MKKASVVSSQSGGAQKELQTQPQMLALHHAVGPGCPSRAKATCCHTAQHVLGILCLMGWIKPMGPLSPQQNRG